MRGNFRLILSDNLIKISFTVSLFLIFLQVLLTVIFINHLPPLIPFLNSKEWGASRLLPSSSIILVPLAFLGVFIVNNFLSGVFYKKNTLISRLLSFNSLLFIFLGILAFIQIIFLVF